ncbi:hypothetical protein PGTUg99_006136 [Puccinia graminis f. sp. tritici]|uniref:SAM domain-containing protein n=1 Tax=Puccinia graminis f. sp. tritici TaxID=56615 RepID=A0A5B0QGU4_PUCGR|nr:hypothetical protein PGTUg99_006136 [Puccinia graminis f. sp. tritici]
MTIPTESIPSPPDTFQESQVPIVFQETQGSEYIPNSQELESQDFPESLPVPDGSKLYCKFDLDYSIWVNNSGNTSLVNNLRPAKPPCQLRMSVTDMSFSDFKTRVYNHLAATPDHSLLKSEHLVKALTNADKADQLQWCCSIKNCERVVTDDASFKSFVVVAGIQFGACNFLLFMDKPCRSNQFRAFHSDDDIGDVVFKRFKAFQQTELSSPKTAISMIDFLQFCRIPLDDHDTRSIIQDHKLHHWTVFIDLSHEDLKELGFRRGPILLFRQGVDRLIHGKHEFDP